MVSIVAVVVEDDVEVIFIVGSETPAGSSARIEKGSVKIEWEVVKIKMRVLPP